MTQTTYQIKLDTEEQGEDDDVVRAPYTLTFASKEDADAVIPLLRIAIKQGVRCGKVSVTSDIGTSRPWNTLTDAEKEVQVTLENEAEAIWESLNLPDYMWITRIKSYQKVTTEDLSF